MTSTDRRSLPPTPAALRKRRQRARQRAGGLVPVTVDVPVERTSDLHQLAADLRRSPGLPLAAAGVMERLAEAEHRAAVAASREAITVEEAEEARRKARALALELTALQAVVEGHRVDIASLVPWARVGRLLQGTGWRARVARWLLEVS